MAQPINGGQMSLFPTRDSIEEVEQEALAMLPITNGNQLIALLRMQQNTIHSLHQGEIDEARDS
jgi:hypothetical protein